MLHFLRKANALRIGFIEAQGKDRRSYGIPLAFGYLIGLVKRFWGAEVETFLANDTDDLIERRPALVGITSVSSTFQRAVMIAEEVKGALGVPVVIGGQHITPLWHTLPSNMDVAVLGEGEWTFLELVGLLKNQRWGREWFSRIPGLAYDDGQKVRRTAERQQIANLDVLPFPARTTNPAGPAEATIMTSRGCPYGCTFCSSARHWGSFRTFSAPYVVQEIMHIRRTMKGISQMYVLDDLFVADRQRLSQIVDGIRANKLNQKLSFHGFARADMVDEELCHLLQRMNMKSVRFGAESGSDRVLSRIKAGGATVADNQRAVDLLHAFELRPRAAFMVGIPGETEEDMAETFEFIERNKGKMSVGGFYLTVPFPGTPLWDQALEKGLVTERMDWSRLNLDFRSPDFPWDDFLYLNEETVPRNRFLALLRQSGLVEVPT